MNKEPMKSRPEEEEESVFELPKLPGALPLTAISEEFLRQFYGLSEDSKTEVNEVEK